MARAGTKKKSGRASLKASGNSRKAARTRASRTVYRDRNTGRFTKKSTWKRSRAQGGIRFVRQSIRQAIQRKLQKPELKPSRPASLPTNQFKEPEFFGDEGLEYEGIDLDDEDVY